MTVFFSRKIHYYPNLGKKRPKSPQNFVISFSLKWSKIETNIVGISPPISYLAKFWFSSYWPKCCQPIKLQVSLKCDILRKKWVMKFVFCMQINIEVLYKLILSFWVCPTRYAQSTKNKTFVHLCNIFRKARGMKLIFLPANKHKSFLQVDRITLSLCSQKWPKYPKQLVYDIFVKYLEKREGWTWSLAYR